MTRKKKIKIRANNSQIPLGERSEDGNQKSGAVYVVATPIGNMEDMTFRALRILKSVDLIAAENMTRTRGLCRHYDIKTRITSYNQHNQKIKAPGLIGRLKQGLDIAIVTDAGTPGISDPGVYIINLAGKENIKVVPIPGPSAVIAALSVSGFPTQEFVFLGFLPNKAGKRKNVLKNMDHESRTMVFFEAPHRLIAALTDIYEIFGDRQIVLLREMTKVFEEAQRGTAKAILEHIIEDGLKGECTLVVAGYRAGANPRTLDKRIINKIELLLDKKGMTIKDIAGMLSAKEGVPYRQIYKECLARKRGLERAGMNGVG